MDTGTEYENTNIDALIEGLIFTSGEEGLSLIQIQAALENTARAQIEASLRRIQEKFDQPSSGIELARFGSRWKLVAREMVYPCAIRLYGSEGARPLSGAAMEVLALVAYRQPITRVQIDEIRGVGSDMMLKKLQARGLIETCGHLDAIGRPLLYQVTPAFLDCFGIESLEDLPEVSAPAQQETLFQESRKD